MKYILILLTVCLSIQAKPVFYINDNNSIDLDTLYPKEYKFKYYLKNLGDDDLQIESLGASCGCTDINIDARTIKPSDSAALNITINLQKFTGERIYYLYFETNDPDLPELKLPIRFFVYRDLLINPKDLPIKFNIKSEEEIEYKFNIMNLGDKDLILKIPIEDNAQFDILEFSGKNETIKSGVNKTLTLKLKYKKGAGFVSTKLKIPTTSKAVPLVEMQLTGSVND